WEAAHRGARSVHGPRPRDTTRTSHRRPTPPPRPTAVLHVSPAAHVPGEIGIVFCVLKQPITVFEHCGCEQPVSHRRHACPLPRPLQLHAMVQQYYV
ncbi:hypothetical protein GW17_00048649, partial [Ensete ventricosum]